MTRRSSTHMMIGNFGNYLRKERVWTYLLQNLYATLRLKTAQVCKTRQQRNQRNKTKTQKLDRYSTCDVYRKQTSFDFFLNCLNLVREPSKLQCARGFAAAAADVLVVVELAASCACVRAFLQRLCLCVGCSII